MTGWRQLYLDLARIFRLFRFSLEYLEFIKYFWIHCRNKEDFMELVRRRLGGFFSVGRGKTHWGTSS